MECSNTTNNLVAHVTNIIFWRIDIFHVVTPSDSVEYVGENKT